MNVICIIQARMGSSRLPGKVLHDLEGRPMLHRVVSRVLEAKTVGAIVVATTDNPKDDAIIAALKDFDGRVTAFRGSEKDVLDRYYQAATEARADIVVRVTSDCPLIDPDLIDSVVSALLQDPSLDYASNTLGRRTYPRGLDVEAMTFAALEATWKAASEPDEREHVTLYIRKQPERFRARNLEGPQDFSYHRWTVDEEADERLAKELFRRLTSRPHFRMSDVLALFDEDPSLFKINQGVVQKPNDGRKIVACIQARMGSTRLPKKVLMDLQGAPVIIRIFRRLQACRNVDQVVLATADTPENAAVVACAEAHHLPCYAGAENDIVDRLHQAAKAFGATAILRITADCPLVDPEIVDAVAAAWLADPSLDYVSNVVPPTYPDGLDVELLSAEALARLWERSRGDAFLSEWFGHDIRSNPQAHRTRNIALTEDLSKLRWTVDYPEDMAFAREVFSRLSPNGELFHMRDVMKLLEAHPEIEAMNAMHVRDEAYHQALAERKAKAL